MQSSLICTHGMSSLTNCTYLHDIIFNQPQELYGFLLNVVKLTMAKKLGRREVNGVWGWKF